MLDKADQIINLFGKHLKGELSLEERAVLQELLESSDELRQLFNRINSEEELTKRLDDYYKKVGNLSSDDIKMAFSRTIEPTQVVALSKHRNKFLRWVVAASAIIVVSMAIYFFQQSKQPVIAEGGKNLESTRKEIMPANGSMILVRQNGEQVVLDQLENGVVTTDGGKNIVKQDDQLSYQGESKEIVYNTLLTTKGKIAKLRLADQTMVYLNAESSIRFPTEFAGNERIVEVTGEVFFDVTKNTAKPFRVQIKQEEGKICDVLVTGTQFNISAYSNESKIATTLLEGAVTVIKGDQKKSLVSGQQAALFGGKFEIVEPNIDAIVAWKERNFFYFRNNDIKSMMRQLERWYPISVKYEGNITGRTFSGQVSRELSLSVVLSMLEQANIPYLINGSELTIKN